MTGCYWELLLFLNFLDFVLLGFLKSRLKNPSFFIGSQSNRFKTDELGVSKLALVMALNCFSLFNFCSQRAKIGSAALAPCPKLVLLKPIS